VCENFVLLMVAYQWCGKLPRPLSGAAAKALDFFISTRLIPDGLRDRILERRRYRLDWKYFIGIDY